MTQIRKHLKIKQYRKIYKRQIIEEIIDYENSITDTNIEHLRDMLNSMYDVTGWQPTTLEGYIRCAKYENSMRNVDLWYIPT